MARRRSGFTTRATCLLAGGITAVLCGLLLGELDLVRAGVLAAAIPCVAALTVARSRVRIANRRSVQPLRAEAGTAVTVQLAISNRSVLRTGVLMLEDELPRRLTGSARFVLDPLGGHETRTVSYRLPGLGRGRYAVGPLRTRLRDPFGMIDVTRSFTARSEFVLTPVVDDLPSPNAVRSDDLGSSAGSSSVGAHGADDQSTREYRIGDDLRKIHWRSSARTGALMVRQEERPWRGQTTILLDLRAQAHARDPDNPSPAEQDPRLTASLEWAVSAAASVGTQALGNRRQLSLLADSSGPRRFADPADYAVHLAGVRVLDYANLTPFAAAVRSAARDSALVAVLGHLDAATLRMLADAHPRGSANAAFALVLDIATWLNPDAEPTAGQVRASAEVLAGAGWRVAVVRRGDSTAQAWQTLLASSAAAVRVDRAAR